MVLAVAATLHLPGLLRGDWYLFRDATSYGYPNEQLLREALRAGRLPHLNPLVHGGIPHLADPATLSLYPPAWVTALLPPPASSGLFVLLHAVLAGLGAATLAREAGVGPRGQALTGGAFSASGFVLSFQESQPFLAGVAWLPWVLALALRLARAAPGAETLRSLVGLAATSALLGLANAPLAAQGVSCAALLLLVSGARAGLLRRAGLLAAWGGLAALLAGAQLLPAVRWLPLSADRSRGYDLASASLWSTSPWRALELFVPWPFGSPFPDAHGFSGRALLSGDRVHFLADTLYVGPLLLLLAGLGLWVARRRGGASGRGLALLAAAALLGALLALGAHTPLFALVHALPGAGAFRYPEKLMVWPTLAVCLLAGAGLGAVRSPDLPRWVAWAPAGLIPLLLLARGPLLSGAGGLVAPERRPALAAQLDAGVTRALLLLALATLALVLTRRGGGRAWTIALALLALADPLSANAARLYLGGCPYPPAPDTVVLVRQELAQRPLPGRVAVDPAPLGVRPGPGSLRRFLEREQARTLETHRWYELPRGDGFASWVPWRLAWFRAQAPALTERLLATQARVEPRGAPLDPGATLLGEVPDLGLRVVRPADPLPFAWVVPRAATRGAVDTAEATRRVTAPGFDPAREAVLVGWDPGTPPAGDAGGWAAPVTGRREGPGLVLELTLPAPGTILVSQLYLPAWRATVDGAEAPLYPGQGLILGLPLPPGTHTVRLEPTTPGLLPGLACSGAGLVVAAVLLLRAWGLRAPAR